MTNVSIPAIQAHSDVAVEGEAPLGAPRVHTCAAIEGDPSILTVRPLLGMPEVAAGTDLAGALLDVLTRAGVEITDGDILVVSSKVVSKAAALYAPMEQRAALVLKESSSVVAERMTASGITRIARSLAGPVLAGAGIDASNVGGRLDQVLLLPRDPDAAAERLRDNVNAAIRERSLNHSLRWGLLLTDTAGRPWRAGLADIALGAAGMPVLDDLRGSADADGRLLSVTVRAVADELAGAADLVKGKSEGIPAVLIRGWRWPAQSVDSGAAPAPTSTGSPTDATSNASSGPDRPRQTGAAALLRAGPADWFSLGTAEAVRAALGAAPGTHAALDIGIPGNVPEEMDIRIERACRLARLDGLGRIPPGHPRARLAGDRPDPESARLDIVQFGVLAEAPDELTLGAVVARLLAALAGEEVPAAWARTDPATESHGPRALVLFTGEG